MKQTHRAKAMRIVAFILTVILSIALCISLAACNNGNQPNTPNPPQNNNNNNNNYPETQEPETPDGNEDNKDNDEDPNEQEQPGEQQQPGGQEQPDDGTNNTTEAEYKAKFEAELPGYIENFYNNNFTKTKYDMIDSVSISLINAIEGTIYFECISKESRINRFICLFCQNIINFETYKKLYEAVENNELTLSKDIFFNQSRITEQGVPEDICAFALSQQRVQDFLYANGVDSSDLINYKVINTTEFKSSKVEPYYFYLERRGQTIYIEYCFVSDVTLIVGDKIFTVRIGTSSTTTTGVNETQRDYLTGVQYYSSYYGKDIYGVDYLSISYMTICDYEELSLHQETVNN